MLRSFFSSAIALSWASFGQLGLVDLVFEFGHLVAAVLAFAELLLNRLQLLVEVVLALGLLHLALDAVADALLDLKDADLAFHVAEHLFQPFGHGLGFEQLLLLGDLQRQVRGDRVGELARIVDLVDRHQHLRRNLLVELDVLLELRDHGAGQRLDFLMRRPGVSSMTFGIGLKESLVLGKALDARALAAFDQHLDRAVRQLEELQHRADRADRVDIRGRRIVLRGVLLGDEQDLLIVLHHVFERPHRFLAADKERHDHVRENDDVAERQDRIERGACGFRT